MVLALYISRNIHYELFCDMLVLSNAVFLSVIHDDMCNDSQFIIAACKRFHHMNNAIYLSLQCGWIFVLFPVWICCQPCCHQHSGHQSWHTQKTLFKNRTLNSGSLSLCLFNCYQLMTTLFFKVIAPTYTSSGLRLLIMSSYSLEINLREYFQAWINIAILQREIYDFFSASCLEVV